MNNPHMHRPERVDILGVQVCVLDQEQLVETVRQQAVRLPGDERKAFRVFYVNAHSLNMAAVNPALKSVLNAAELVYSDGISVVGAARFLWGTRLHKLTGRVWIYPFCAMAERTQLRLFILAGQPGIAERAAQQLRLLYPNLQVVGWADGFFSQDQEPELIEKINRLHPDVLWVGLGTPRQEQWLTLWHEQLNAPVCWAVGALFDYLAGIEKPVPTWLDHLGFEWLWRLIMNPTGKWRRYLLGNPEFVLRVAAQKLAQILGKV